MASDWPRAAPGVRGQLCSAGLINQTTRREKKPREINEIDISRRSEDEWPSRDERERRGGTEGTIRSSPPESRAAAPRWSAPIWSAFKLAVRSQGRPAEHRRGAPIRARRAVPLRSNTPHANKEQRLKLSAKTPRQKQPARSAAVSGANLLRTGRLRPLRALFFFFFLGYKIKAGVKWTREEKRKQKDLPEQSAARRSRTRGAIGLPLT